MKRLGEILLERGFATVGELHTALEACHRHRSRLGTQLLRLGFVTEKQLLEALSEQAGRPPVPREMLQETNSELRTILPLKVAQRLRAVPFSRVHRQLQVAFNNPRDDAAIEEIQGITGLVVEAFVATESSLMAALEALTREAAGEEISDTEVGQDISADGWDSLWKAELPGPDVLLALGEVEDPAPGSNVVFATY